MSEPVLRILAPTRYPWTFNGPRHSYHNIEKRQFVPFNKISSKIEGITILNPFPLKKFDFIHAFNRIPLGLTPYMIGFESHLPRAFGMDDTKYFEKLCRSLAGDRCHGIFAISEYAKRQFINQHQNHPWFDALMNKLQVRYPNLPMPEGGDSFDGQMDKLNLIFIGNHFVRKGGTAILKLAKLAEDQNLPIHIDIVSSLQMGGASWVDPLSSDYFDPYQSLLSTLKNVKIHGSLPNKKVLQLLKNAHFSLLPTFSDTFGFSAIESMANYVPVMATAQCALPEFIIDGQNGFLLPLPTDKNGEWIHIGHRDRGSKAYAELFDAESDRLASIMFSHLQNIIGDKEKYLSLRQKARNKAEELFSSTDANAFWDGVYESQKASMKASQ